MLVHALKIVCKRQKALPVITIYHTRHSRNSQTECVNIVIGKPNAVRLFDR